MNDRLLAQIKSLLAAKGIEFKELEHPPTRTSEESAAARNEELGVGAKAIVLRTDDVFRLFVLPADMRLDSAAVKRHLGVKRIRFATTEELVALADLVPGAVPPFGEPLLPLELFADTELGARYPRIAFNAGALTVSIIMSASDWESVARPKRFQFAKA